MTTVELGPNIYEDSVLGIPRGRGRWRLMLRRRDYIALTGNEARPSNYELADLTDARSRRLTRTLNQPAQLTFSIPGDSPAAYMLRELEHEVVAFRAREYLAPATPGTSRVDEVMFRGIITHSQDTVSEQVHTVNFTCFDPLWMVNRRWLAQPVNYSTPTSQDTIAQQLLGVAQAGHTSAASNTFNVAARLGLQFRPAHPDGAGRIPGDVPTRTRFYETQTNIGEAIANLANVIGGFDFDVRPSNAGQHRLDDFSVYYPNRGVLRNHENDFAFVYGSTVSAFSRSINAGSYANYVRVIGQPPSEGAAPIWAEAWIPGINDVITHPEGLWWTVESQADVSMVSTLVETSQGILSDSHPLAPSYSLTLRPGAYQVRRRIPSEHVSPVFDVGDMVRLRVRRGRIDIEDWVRVMGITFVIGDDGEEDVQVEVGPLLRTFASVFQASDRRVSALERR